MNSKAYQAAVCRLSPRSLSALGSALIMRDRAIRGLRSPELRRSVLRTVVTIAVINRYATKKAR